MRWALDHFRESGSPGPGRDPRSVANAGGRISGVVLAAARASGYEPHDDEDGHRYQRDDDERLERGEDPARNRDDKPDGEDRAEDCPDDPAHVPIMLPAA